MTSSTRRVVLFITNSDYGQSNVFLATAHAMRRMDPDVEIHIASHKKLEGSVHALNEELAAISSTSKPTSFHLIEGMAHVEATLRPGNLTAEAHPLPSSFLNNARKVYGLRDLFHPWTPEESVDMYRNIQRIYEGVKPDVTVVDDLFNIALTFCESENVHWISLAPNTLKDFAVPVQPYGASLWKYPILHSALPFPIPWHKIPINAFYVLVAGYGMLTDNKKRLISDHFKKQIGPHVNHICIDDLGLLRVPPQGLKILVANSPDIEFPLDVIPDYTIPCGPIIRAAPPIASTDPELAAWLRRSPTIYMNLGTNVYFPVEWAKEVAYAFRIFLDRAVAAGFTGEDRFQILWKMPRQLAPGEETYDPTKYEGEWADFRKILGAEMDDDQVRIVKWIQAEPKSVLESGHVVCSINHAGANSFNEALCAGIPQVLLPGWIDCYDFGSRAEILGIGRWANKKVSQYWEREELAYHLEQVVIGPNAKEYQGRALAVSKRHPESAGREKAAKEILSQIK